MQASRSDTLPSILKRLERPALIVGIIAAIPCIVAAFFDVQAFLQSYLTAFIFWLGIALGCLAVVMIQNLAGGYWGAVIRRFLEAGTRLLLPMAVLFVPILVGMPLLYGWTHPGGFPDVTLPSFKRAYLNVPFFIGRAVLYFAVWIILAHLLTRWSLERDRTSNPELTRRLRNLSAGGLVLFALTVTFAAIDWLMSLEAAWFSSIYGAMIAMGMLLSGFAFVTALTAFFAPQDPLSEVVNPDLLNNLGSLLLAFLMLWAYLAFSQFILIYAGNIPDEIIWYVQRISNGWLGVGLVVVALHFAVPFCTLILRGAKRNRRTLAAVATLLVVMHYVDLYWVIKPAFGVVGIGVTWLDVVLPVALGGLWLAYFSWQLTRWPLLPASDPRLLAHVEVVHENA